MTKLSSYLACAAIMLAVVTGLAFGANSPIGKGSSLVSGTGSYTSQGGDLYEYHGNRYNRLSLQGSVSTFVSTGFYIGGQFLLESISQGGSVFGIGIGPKIGYVFGGGLTEEVKGSVLPYLGTSLMYKSASGGGASATGTSVSFSGGFIQFVSRSVALNFEGVYQIDSIESIRGNSFGIVAGFGIFLWE